MGSGHFRLHLARPVEHGGEGGFRALGFHPQAGHVVRGYPGGIRVAVDGHMPVRIRGLWTFETPMGDSLPSRPLNPEQSVLQAPEEKP